MTNTDELEDQDLKSKVSKRTFALVDNCYTHPNTSTLAFQFEPHMFISSDSRLRGATIQHASVENRNLYILDHFFLSSEGTEMRASSQAATFSRNSYGSAEAIEKGEKPARTMTGKERWQLFSNPPTAIAEIYKLFSTFSAQLDADITTLPWELCDQSGHGSPAVIVNKLEEVSEESMGLGKHQDCNPNSKISFAIPILYSEANEIYADKFINGECGKPYLITVMLYTTAENFIPEYCMGTVFYDDHDKIALRVNSLNMRLVLFEGDIFHSIEESKIPYEVKTWRTSYVFKLLINPRAKNQNVKEAFFNLMKKASILE